jgi:hypothetical protein
LTNEARAALALPQLRKLLAGWLKGKTFEVMQSTLKTTARDKTKCIGARKFVLRIVPNIAHFMSALALIEKNERDDEKLPLPVALEKLNFCIRRGFFSTEMAAVYSTLPDKRVNRREVHRLLAKLKPHMESPSKEETWEGTCSRIEQAIVVELFSRDMPGDD